MARLLYRLGAYCASHRLAVGLSWMVVALIVGFVGITGGSLSDGEFEIPGAESSEALKTLEREFFSSGEEDEQELELVFVAPEGRVITDPLYATDISGILSRVDQLEPVIEVSDPYAVEEPYISADGTTAVANISIEGLPEDEEAKIDAFLDELNAIFAESNTTDLTIETGGSLADSGPGFLSIFELMGATVAFLVLLLTLGSLAAAGANMMTALIGVIVGILSILAFSAFNPIEDSSLILAMMLGLAVGIDYGLFILARFRSELREGRSVHEAAAIATGTAGSAVIFAGTTVVIALSGLAIVNIPFVTEMGFAAAGAVVIAVILALTLVPTMLGVLGFRALPRRERAHPTLTDGSSLPVTAVQTTRISFFERWADVVIRRPVASLVTSVALLLFLAIPVLSLDTALEVPGGDNPGSSERRAYDIISEKFGEGSQSPLIVLVESSDATGAATIASDLILDIENVVSVSPTSPNEANTVAILVVTATNGPNDQSTANVVNDLRSALGGIANAQVSVTGQTAVDIDVNAQLNSALFTYIFVIVGLALVLLVLMFRSILVPLIATIGFLLSLGAGLGVTIAVFQWGWLSDVFGVAEPAPIMSLLPMIIVGILFGLAMDYQVFLVSRIHEAHVRKFAPREAILHGFGHSGIIVAAAATIMAAVFVGFSLSGDDLIASMALALTAGVIADAFIVRMIIIPAMLTIFGNRSWWLPSWLDRLVPHLNVENRRLQPATRSGVPEGSVAE